MIKLGEKIRTLRKQKNISQEVLAGSLGVSFQAVSKWETGAAMPDVTLIPAIASFFGVSTDELFDFNLYETEQKVMEICRQAWDCRDEEPEKAEAILREGLKRFPGNDTILNNLLCVIPYPERAGELIDLCRAVIEGTKCDDVKYDACRIMAQAYKSIGEYGLCKEAVEMIPEIYFTKLNVAAELFEGEDMFEPAVRQRSLDFEGLVRMSELLADYYLKKGEKDKAAIHLRTAIAVLEAVKDDFPTPYTRSLYEANVDWRDSLEEKLSKAME